MTKTVKELLGEKRNPYLRSKADQKFAADFTTDTSINNDDATEHEPNFKATNVASVEREKEGHGWDTEDISSKDGTDLEDADFKGTEKRLKAYKKLTAVSESSYGNKRDYPKIDIHHKGKYVGTTTWAKNTKVAKAKYLEKNPDRDPAHVKASYVKEQQYKFLQGTNISPSKQSKTLKKIANNSAKKADDAGNKADKEPWQKGNRSLHLNMMADALKQRSGVIKDYLDKRKSRAVKEEAARLDELGTNTLVRYMVKAEKQGRSDKKLKLAAKKYKEAVDRQSPIGIGSQKPRKLKEDTVDLNEISKDLAKRYMKKSIDDENSRNNAIRKNFWKSSDSTINKATEKNINRRRGQDRAFKIIAKEEVLAELSKATLQSYVKKAKQSRSNHGKAADAFISGAEKEYARGNTKSAEKHLDRADHHNMKSIKRKVGINKAENRLAEEIARLDEISFDKAKAYVKKSVVSRNEKEAEGKDSGKRVKGINLALNKAYGGSAKVGTGKGTPNWAKVNEEFEQLDEASKVELYGRYVSDIKTTMTEVGKLLSTLAKHNQEGWIDLYSIRETFNRVQILRDDISGSVEVAERDAAQRKKWAKEEQKTVSLREGVELFNNLPRRRNV